MKSHYYRVRTKAIEEMLTRRIIEIKGDKVTEHHARELAHAVMVEASATLAGA